MVLREKSNAAFADGTRGPRGQSLEALFYQTWADRTNRRKGPKIIRIFICEIRTRSCREKSGAPRKGKNRRRRTGPRNRRKRTLPRPPRRENASRSSIRARRSAATIHVPAAAARSSRSAAKASSEDRAPCEGCYNIGVGQLAQR